MLALSLLACLVETCMHTTRTRDTVSRFTMSADVALRDISQSRRTIIGTLAWLDQTAQEQPHFRNLPCNCKDNVTG